MYTLLTGAKKNIGDYLIVEKCKEHLRKFCGMSNYIEFKRWEPLENYLNKINSTKAIILCGGPGYRRDFYPNSFALTKKLTDIKVPIIPFGLGWSGQPMNKPELFSFTSESLRALKFIHKNITYSSCRDIITKKILETNGLTNVIMTGCPVWHSIEHENQNFKKPSPIRSIAISNSQNIVFHEQNSLLLKKIREYFGEDVKIFSVFHRGIKSDSLTPAREARSIKQLVKTSEELQMHVVDAAYDVSKMSIYDQCDIHVGYRLHAHLYCLSHRVPSFLIWEDGRGLGASTSLSLNDVSAFKKNSFYPINNLATKILYKAHLHKLLLLNPSTVKSVIERIDNNIKANFSFFDIVPSILSKRFQDLKKFLTSIPQ